jgi:antitoxin MazE
LFFSFKSNYFVITKYHAMELSVIRIGNSKGIRLSKSILERYDIRDRVEIILEKGRIILKPASNPRQGWGEAFRKMSEKKEDGLLIPDLFSEETEEEWI